MITREFCTTLEDGTKLYRTYSSVGKKILQQDTGYIYDEAIDIETTNHIYVETDEDVEEPVYLEPQEALDVIFGGQTDGEIHEE